MKKLRWLLMAILVLAAACIGFVACDTSGGGLSAPQGLELRDGVLEWDEVSGADSYEVSVNGSDYTAVEGTEADLLTLVTSKDVTKVYVRGVKGGEKGEAAEFAITVVQLDAPEKPTVEQDPDTHALRIKWNEVANGNRYLVTITTNGTAGREITYNRNYFEPTSTGNYSLVVKAKGYSSGNTLYLTSAASPASDVVEYLEGPVLAVANINEISWTTGETEFDSFNLYINNQKVRENVEMPTEGAYNLVTGSDPVLTKTGEYTVQIEAIKNGVSYWSNQLVEFGTSNINENEIYSFDNRKVNFTVSKPGVTVTDEQKHGDSGYSLKIDTTGIEQQLNFVQYSAEGINDIDFRNVAQVTYWLYIEPCDTWTEDTMPYHVAPKIKYDVPNTLCNPVSIDGVKVGDPDKDPEATDEIPVGEWVEVVIDCVNQHSNVLIMSFIAADPNIWPDNTGRYLTMYLDDITYTELLEAGDTPTDVYEYTLSYDRLAMFKGAWFGTEFIELDFGTDQANEKVTFELQIAGNLPETSVGNVGIFSTVNPNNVNDGNFFNQIPNALLQDAGTWTDFTLTVQLNAEGKIYLTAHNQSADAAFDIFIKDEITVAENPAIELKQIGTFWYAAVPLKTDLPVGTLVEVELPISVTSSSQYSVFGYADMLWQDDGAPADDTIRNEPPYGGVFTEAQKGNGSTAGWVTKTFQTKVVDFDTVAFLQNKTRGTFDLSDAGNYVLLYIQSANENDSFRIGGYKITDLTGGADITAEMRQVGSMWFSAIALETDLPVGAPVSVTMQVDAATTSKDGLLQYVTSLWGDNAPNEGDVFDGMNKTEGGWDTDGYKAISFTAKVVNFAEIDFNQASFNGGDFKMTGNYVLVVFQNGNAGDHVWIKDVQITDLTGGAEYVGEIRQVGTFYFSAIALTTDLAVGTEVSVTMKVDAATKSDFGMLQYAISLYGDNTPNDTEGGTFEGWGPTAGGWDTDGYKEVTFTAKVVDFAEVDFNQNGTIAGDFKMTGNYVLIVLQNGNADDHVWIKDVVITAAAA